MNRYRFLAGMTSDISLSDEIRRRLIRRIIANNSKELLCTVSVEEFAELQQQVSKQLRGFDDKMGLIEEMADAYICLQFLESIFDIDKDMLKKAVDVKLKRNYERKSFEYKKKGE